MPEQVDPNLVEPTLWTGLAFFLVQLLRMLRDEGERWKHKRNGGTPQEEMVKELKGLRRDASEQNKLILKSIKKNRNRLDELLERSRRNQAGR